MSSKPENVNDRPLDIEEIRLVSDLRILHSKVAELYRLVADMRERHDESAIVTYADDPVISEEIRRVDEIYLWFVRIREEVDRRKAKSG